LIIYTPPKYISSGDLLHWNQKDDPVCVCWQKSSLSCKFTAPKRWFISSFCFKR